MRAATNVPTNSENELFNHIISQVKNKIIKEKGGQELYNKNEALKAENLRLKAKMQ
jgi:hypothetical protein